MKTKSLITLFFLMLSGCGPSSEMVEIKINSGISTGRNFKNLSKEMFSIGTPVARNGIRCNQNNLSVGFRATDGSMGGHSKVSLSSWGIPSFNPGTNTTADFLTVAEFSLDVPTRLMVPKNKPIEIGIFGTLLATDRYTQDGDCGSFPSWLVTAPYILQNAFIVSGHQQITVRESSEVNINALVANNLESTLNSTGMQEFTQFQLTGNTACIIPGLVGYCNVCFRYNNIKGAPSTNEQCFGDLVYPPWTVITVPKIYPQDLYVKFYDPASASGPGSAWSSSIQGTAPCTGSCTSTSQFTMTAPMTAVVIGTATGAPNTYTATGTGILTHPSNFTVTSTRVETATNGSITVSDTATSTIYSSATVTATGTNATGTATSMLIPALGTGTFTSTDSFTIGQTATATGTFSGTSFISGTYSGIGSGNITGYGTATITGIGKTIQSERYMGRICQEGAGLITISMTGTGTSTANGIGIPNTNCP